MWGEPIGWHQHAPPPPRDVLKACGLDSPSSSQTIPIKFLLAPSKSICSHQLLIKFLLFPTQPYVNLHKVLNFGIRSFSLQLASLHIFFFGWHNMAYPTIAHCSWNMVHFQYVFWVTHHGCFWKQFFFFGLNFFQCL
jgi:hypothetical protein